MIIQRKRGLQTTVLMCQSAVVVLLFGLCAAGTFARHDFVADVMLWHYFIYAGVIIGGLALESLNRIQTNMRSGEDFLNQHRLTHVQHKDLALIGQRAGL